MPSVYPGGRLRLTTSRTFATASRRSSGNEAMYSSGVVASLLTMLGSPLVLKWGWECLGYVLTGLIARIADRRSDRVGIVATAHQEHPDALEGFRIGWQGPAAEVASERIGRTFRLGGWHRRVLGTAVGRTVLGS